MIRVFAAMTATLLFCAQSFAAFDHSHAKWDEVLKKHVVVNGPASSVKYSEIAKDPKTLDAYLAEVSAVKKDEFDKWSKEQKLAFLFNSYNAYTVKLILNGMKDNPNLKSIKDLGGLLSNPWKKKFFSFLGEESHLDRIEHEITRKNFDEPRLHMAFNCASIGCPALLNEAFKPEKLDSQLDQATRSFLADSSRNRYDAGSNTLFLSSIFKWYGDDFEDSKTQGPLRKFVTDHMKLDEQAKKKILSGEAKIKFLDYNWGLNKAG